MMHRWLQNEQENWNCFGIVDWYHMMCCRDDHEECELSGLIINRLSCPTGTMSSLSFLTTELRSITSHHCKTNSPPPLHHITFNFLLLIRYTHVKAGNKGMGVEYSEFICGLFFLKIVFCVATHVFFVSCHAPIVEIVSHFFQMWWRLPGLWLELLHCKNFDDITIFFLFFVFLLSIFTSYVLKGGDFQN